MENSFRLQRENWWKGTLSVAPGKARFAGSPSAGGRGAVGVSDAILDTTSDKQRVGRFCAIRWSGRLRLITNQGLGNPGRTACLLPCVAAGSGIRSQYGLLRLALQFIGSGLV